VKSLKENIPIETKVISFERTKNENLELKKMIQQSWLRSKENKIDPNRKQGKVDIKRWKKGVEKNKELIQTSLPLMEDLYQLVKGSGFSVILCDQNGLLLKMIGDKETLKQAKSISFVEGADWSEEEIGTNAIGTCIKEEIPLQVFSYEHYSKICQEWTCSASPIFESDGNLIGVLNMSGPFEKVHPHTLGMVVSAAKAIEGLMNLQEKAKRNDLMKSYLEATMNALPSGIILVNQQGRIIQANKTLQDMLHLNERDLLEKQLYQVFHNKLFLDTSILNSIKDKEIFLKTNNSLSGKHVLLNSKPVYQGDVKIGSVLAFQEIQKVRQLVNKFTGNKAKTTFKEIYGTHPKFVKCIKEAIAASKSPSNVLLLGESGTGKDLFAQAIHNESNRRSMPFIAINCGAIPRDLLGSELVGYVEGAFTGARKGGSPGKFELADGGTIFLDEIGEMPLDMQVLLLRVLQNKEITRIGDHKVIPVDVRVIAATNKNLIEEVRKGNFREDLYFRLNVLPIHIPSLRERKEDIPLLAEYFFKIFNPKIPRRIEFMSSSYIEALLEYQWPGNVRELQNVIERSMNRCTCESLNVEALPEEVMGGPFNMKTENFQIKKEMVQRQLLIDTIQECNYNYSKAAEKLGISRSTFYRWMVRYQLR
jgi:transcriptional regulator of acetoin/glycerol metabolism